MTTEIDFVLTHIVPIGTIGTRSTVNDRPVGVIHILESLERFDGTIRGWFIPSAHGSIQVVWWIEILRGIWQMITDKLHFAGGTDIYDGKVQTEAIDDDRKEPLASRQ